MSPLMEEVLQKLRELYPSTQIVIWEKNDSAKLYVDGHMILRFNIDMLSKQLSENVPQSVNNTIKYFAQYIEQKYLSRKKDFKKKVGKPSINLTPAQIEFANSNTQSVTQAAKFLGICRTTYAKYAKKYGMYESQLATSAGIPRKSKSYARIPLEDIFANKHPRYKIHHLKERLIRELVLEEKCENCGYNIRREQDHRMALILNFKDGNSKNMSRDNLRFLCYNCVFNLLGKISIKHAKRLARISMEKLMVTDVEDTGNITPEKQEYYDSLFDKFNKKGD